ncbi:hypothetical protein [Brucella pseudogrignonensis]|uniref:Uncharacterized protein n=1 Tax=Brucella pseudogrignonensis TaxID=419475 RepID=A0ABU1M7P1_9HYPH|nr:hypothetical protein [Brucella pseudogrignonensis]MDR6432047.1 hypothetical protein [Brucella pseudogrignonensis]
MKKNAKKQNVHNSAELRHRRGGFAGSFVTGLATLLALAGPSSASMQQRPEAGSLRGDFVRLGSDMRTVIVKERKREEASRKKS